MSFDIREKVQCIYGRIRRADRLSPQLRLLEWDYPRLASRLPVRSKDIAWSLILPPCVTYPIRFL